MPQTPRVLSGLNSDDLLRALMARECPYIAIAGPPSPPPFDQAFWTYSDLHDNERAQEILRAKLHQCQQGGGIVIVGEFADPLQMSEHGPVRLWGIGLTGKNVEELSPEFIDENFDVDLMDAEELIPGGVPDAFFAALRPS